MRTAGTREPHKDDGRRCRSCLTDAEQRAAEPVLRRHAPPSADLRGMADACLPLRKAGCPWRVLPKEPGPWQAVRARRKPAVSLGMAASGPTGSGPAIPATAANLRGTRPVGALPDRAAGDGWATERAKAGGTCAGPRVGQAARGHDP